MGALGMTKGCRFLRRSTEMLYPSYYDVDEWNQFLFQLQGFQNQSFLSNGLVAYYPFNGNANDKREYK